VVQKLTESRFGIPKFGIPIEIWSLCLQGRWEDLWKLALKAGERAKARAAKNPRQSKAKSEPQKDNTPRVNWNTTRNSGPHLNRRLIFGKAKRAGIS
jgi:hypothetical protein